MSLELAPFAAKRPRPGRRLRDFLRGSAGERGIAATEFALILPVALTLFTGALVFGTINQINRKITLTARDVTDLVTQYSALSSSDMTLLLNSSAQVMAPFSNSNLTLIVSQVTINSAGVGTINWSVALTGNGYTVGSSVTPPSNIATLPQTTGQSTATVIWGHAAYAYTPSIGYKLTGSFNLSDDVFLSPRISNTINYPASASAP
jgi:Flp pilus assembly protein TadG